MMTTEYLSCDDLKIKIDSDEDLLLLDCRSNDEYRQGHLSNSHNIVLPQLMMRRLKANKLSLKSLVPPNSRQSKDAFLHKCTTYNVILYDFATTELNQDDVTSLMTLLYKRMKQEGCAVMVLKGGYAEFVSQYPELCLKNGSSQTGSLNGSDADDEGCASDDSTSVSPRGGRCSPVSPLREIPPPVLGLGALRITCAQDDDSDYDDRMHRSIAVCPTGKCRRSRDGFNSEGESDGNPNSAGSLSSNASNPQQQQQQFTCSCFRKKTHNSSYNANRNSYNSSAAPAEILPRLFLGCAKDASSEEVLEENNITYILNVTPNLPNVFENDARYKYKQIPIIDHWNQNLSQFFPEAIQFIDEARTRGCGVLVHCLAGISRSVTLTVAYLMQTHKWSLNYAYDFVKLRKNDVSPNFNFMGQLLDFEKQLGLGADQADMDGVNSGSPTSSSSSSSNGSACSGPTLFFTTPATPAPTQSSAFILPTPLA